MKALQLQIGKRYGRLTVFRRGKNEGSHAMWECRCDCGSKVTVRGSGLLRDRISCGCIRGLPVKIGQTFNDLTVLKFADVNAGSRRWACRCVCGQATIATSSQLIRGRKKSCGCRVAKSIRLVKRTHGHCSPITPEYRAWCSMKARCHTKSIPNFAQYGGRGIRVCARWRNSFANFVADVGLKPEPQNIYSLDRIDVNGNYEPKNCRWATRKQQANNRRQAQKRQTALSRFFGVSLCNGKWHAVVKKQFLGGFATELQAAKACDDFIIANNLPLYLNFKRKRAA